MLYIRLEFMPIACVLENTPESYGCRTYTLSLMSSLLKVMGTSLLFLIRCAIYSLNPILRIPNTFCHLLAKSDTTTCRFRLLSRRVCNLQLRSMLVAELGQEVCEMHLQC